MKIEKILIAQPAPANGSPYNEIVSKYGVEVDFHPFCKLETISAREFRAQRISILDYTAIVFTGRTTIDSFFKICEELRITIPDSMKYFCVSEAVAMYLQKHIVYRKRKVFYGDGTPSSIISLIGPKHKGEKFLIAQSDNASHDLENMLAAAGLETKTAVFIKTVYTDLKAIDMSRYQMIVFYNPSDIKSLFESYPDFKQEGMLFATFGKPTAKAMSEYGLSAEVEAPTPEAPSIARALSLYFASHHDEN